MSGENVVLLVRLGFSLSLVFGLMWVAAKVVRTRGGQLRSPRADQLEVLDRKALTRNSSIAIVRIADQTMAVGITDTHVTPLGTVDLAPVDASIETSAVVSVPIAADAAIAVSGAPVDLRGLDARVPATAPTAPRRGVIDLLRDKTVRHVPG